MKFSPAKFFQSRYPLAIGSGLLLALSFPNAGLAGCAWIAPGLMVAAALGTRGAQSFRLGYVAGLAHYLTSLYWLLHIPYRWHGIPLAPMLGWLALSAFLGLYTGTWVWLVTRVSGVRCQVSGEEELSGSTGGSGNGSSTSWIQRTVWALVCGAAWVAMEMGVTRVFGGFPWNLLGASQYRIAPLIQIASVTAVYGISFLLVWTSICLLNAVLAILRKPAWRSTWVAEIILPMLAVFGLFTFGWQRLAQIPAPARTLEVTLIQPSIPQTLIWDSAKSAERFDELLRLSALALTNETDLLIWPEAAIPRPLRYDRDIYEGVTRLARSNRVWMIVGSDDAERREDPKNPDAADFFNSSFLISSEGELAASYAKRNLVIFGEYVPFSRWLPFLKVLAPVENFTAGTRPVPFVLERRPPARRAGDEHSPTASDLRVKTAVLICFEDIFPHLAREYVEADTDFLVNITNDGWFGEAAAQWQQAACAIFRAVENGVPLVRCANTGLTCWVDAGGRMRELFADRNGSVYGPGYMTAEIPLLNPDEPRPPTFYNRHGDWFGWGCVGFTALTLAGSLVRRRNHSALVAAPRQSAAD